MFKVDLKNVASLCVFIIGFSPFLVSAKTCQPELHGDVIIDADSIVIENKNNLFRIDPKGNLFFDVHKVKLNEEQRASLTSYNQTIRNDLPFISQSFSQELYNYWFALDALIASELGDKSSLRAEFGRFHQHLQGGVNSSFYDLNRFPHLDHEKLTQAIYELNSGVPQLIATVSSRGLMDIALLSEGEENKMQFMSQKMATLQEKLMDEITVQRQRTQAVQKDVCNRLGQWQIQEESISALIPALAEWKTVTMR